eukprot:6274089-Pyramimonas_sp.AAC.1
MGPLVRLSRAVQGASWAVLGRGPCWAHVGDVLDRFGAILKVWWAVLDALDLETSYRRNM